MALNLPIPYYTSPYMAEKAIQTIQKAFEASSSMSWLKTCYPAAFVGVRIDNEGNKKTYPQIYRNNFTSFNIDCFPDNSIAPYCFFEINKEVKNDQHLLDLDLSVIFWGDLLTAIPSKTYNYTSELIKAVDKIIKIYGATNIEYIRKHDEIFNKYTGLEEISSQFAMANYFVFKINFSLNNQSLC